MYPLYWILREELRGIWEEVLEELVDDETFV